MNRLSHHQLLALAILLFCVLGVVLGVVQLANNHAPTEGAADSDTDGSFTGRGGDKLILINLVGMITESSDDKSVFSSESAAVKARRELYQAARDKSVKGVLLRIDSPGGTVGMSQELYNAVYAVRHKKPIVVSMGDLAASGGYYTAAAADRIVANPGTLTASIGVILQSVNAEGLLNGKLGVKAITIKSGKFKDILSPYRAATPEDLALLQNIINKSYRQFLGAVLKGRTDGMKDSGAIAARKELITDIADGRVVIGEEALNVGLVDQLGGQEEARDVLRTLAGKRFRLKHPDKLPLQEYRDGFTLLDLFGLSAQSRLRPLSQATGGGTRDMVPLSLRYANRPLWMMEQVY